ncbi:Rsp5p-dependent ubiquitination, sorting of cargo proteins at the multivesicular body [Phlyctochytrium bullatum]|nr:Rsp5p-dependent ubiquitination, sorting of cargo proteins at the multivesicular body [Phlyctochytrium bullatum]
MLKRRQLTRDPRSTSTTTTRSNDDALTGSSSEERLATSSQVVGGTASSTTFIATSSTITSAGLQTSTPAAPTPTIFLAPPPDNEGSRVTIIALAVVVVTLVLIVIIVLVCAYRLVIRLAKSLRSVDTHPALPAPDPTVYTGDPYPHPHQPYRTSLPPLADPRASASSLGRPPADSPASNPRTSSSGGSASNPRTSTSRPRPRGRSGGASSSVGGDLPLETKAGRAKSGSLSSASETASMAAGASPPLPNPLQPGVAHLQPPAAAYQSGRTVSQISAQSSLPRNSDAGPVVVPTYAQHHATGTSASGGRQQLRRAASVASVASEAMKNYWGRKVKPNPSDSDHSDGRRPLVDQNGMPTAAVESFIPKTKRKGTSVSTTAQSSPASKADCKLKAGASGSGADAGATGGDGGSLLRLVTRWVVNGAGGGPDGGPQQPARLARPVGEGVPAADNPAVQGSQSFGSTTSSLPTGRADEAHIVSLSPPSGSSVYALRTVVPLAKDASASAPFPGDADTPSFVVQQVGPGRLALKPGTAAVATVGSNSSTGRAKRGILTKRFGLSTVPGGGAGVATGDGEHAAPPPDVVASAAAAAHIAKTAPAPASGSPKRMRVRGGKPWDGDRVDDSVAENSLTGFEPGAGGAAPLTVMRVEVPEASYVMRGAGAGRSSKVQSLVGNEDAGYVRGGGKVLDVDANGNVTGGSLGRGRTRHPANLQLQTQLSQVGPHQPHGHGAHHHHRRSRSSGAESLRNSVHGNHQHGYRGGAGPAGRRPASSAAASRRSASVPRRPHPSRHSGTPSQRSSSGWSGNPFYGSRNSAGVHAGAGGGVGDAGWHNVMMPTSFDDPLGLKTGVTVSDDGMLVRLFPPLTATSATSKDESSPEASPNQASSSFGGWSARSVQSALPLRPVGPGVPFCYFEVIIVDVGTRPKPQGSAARPTPSSAPTKKSARAAADDRVPSMIAIGLAAKGYPMDRLPGCGLHSVAFASDGTKHTHSTHLHVAKRGAMFGGDEAGNLDEEALLSLATSATSYAEGGLEYGPSFGAGDVVGCGLSPATGGCFFTVNGRYIGEAFFDLAHPGYHATVGADGPCTFQMVLNEDGPFAYGPANPVYPAVSPTAVAAVPWNGGGAGPSDNVGGDDVALDEDDQACSCCCCRGTCEDASLGGPPPLTAATTSSNVPPSVASWQTKQGGRWYPSQAAIEEWDGMFYTNGALMANQFPDGAGGFDPTQGPQGFSRRSMGTATGGAIDAVIQGYMHPGAAPHHHHSRLASPTTPHSPLHPNPNNLSLFRQHDGSATSYLLDPSATYGGDMSDSGVSKADAVLEKLFAAAATASPVGAKAVGNVLDGVDPGLPEYTRQPELPRLNVAVGAGAGPLRSGGVPSSSFLSTSPGLATAVSVASSAWWTEYPVTTSAASAYPSVFQSQAFAATTPHGDFDFTVPSGPTLRGVPSIRPSTATDSEDGTRSLWAAAANAAAPHAQFDTQPPSYQKHHLSQSAASAAHVPTGVASQPTHHAHHHPAASRLSIGSKSTLSRPPTSVGHSHHRRSDSASVAAATTGTGSHSNLGTATTGSSVNRRSGATTTAASLSLSGNRFSSSSVGGVSGVSVTASSAGPIAAVAAASATPPSSPRIRIRSSNSCSSLRGAALLAERAAAASAGAGPTKLGVMSPLATSSGACTPSPDSPAAATLHHPSSAPKSGGPRHRASRASIKNGLRLSLDLALPVDDAFAAAGSSSSATLAALLSPPLLETFQFFGGVEDDDDRDLLKRWGVVLDMEGAAPAAQDRPNSDEAVVVMETDS